MQSYTFDTFYGGISEDDKLAGPGQVLYSEGCDLTTNLQYVTTGRTLESMFETSDNIVTSYYIQRGKNFAVFSTDDKKIYGPSGVELYTADRDVKVFWSNSKWLYWIDQSENIYRILLTNISGYSAWDSNNVENTVSGVLGNSTDNISIIEGEEYCYLGGQGEIVKIELANGTVSDTFGFTSDTVVGMTELGGVIKVYQSDGKMFLWDGVDITYTEKINLGIQIINVSQLANQDFILGGGALYKLNGYQLERVGGAFASTLLRYSKFRLVTGVQNPLASYRGVTYAGSEGGSMRINTLSGSYEFLGGGITTYGIKKNGLPFGINKWITQASNGNNIEYIYSLTKRSYSNQFNEDMYISLQDNEGNYLVNRLDLDQANTYNQKEGLLVLNTFDGGNKNKEKKISKIKVRAKFGDTRQKILVGRMNGSDFIPITGDEITSTIEGKDQEGVWEIIAPYIFYDINFAVILDNDRDSTSEDGAIHFYGLTVDYDFTSR